MIGQIKNTLSHATPYTQKKSPIKCFVKNK